MTMTFCRRCIALSCLTVLLISSLKSPSLLVTAEKPNKEETCSNNNDGTCRDANIAAADKEDINKAKSIHLGDELHASDFAHVDAEFGKTMQNQQKQQQQQQQQGVFNQYPRYNPPDCSLYMAESSIPNSGWGMYTGVNLAKGDAIGPADVVVNVNDFSRNRKIGHGVRRKKGQELLPAWLMNEYFWNAKPTNSSYDAKEIWSIIPGLGMLANSHTGLVNALNEGVSQRPSVPRESPMVGAFTDYREFVFSTNQDLPKGHELMVEYGNEWFEEREQRIGDGIPLSDDYKRADDIIHSLEHICNGNFETNMCGDLWHLIRLDLKNVTSMRLFNAMPSTLAQVQDILKRNSTTAYHSVPNVIRPMDWLKQHGFCLDHIKADESQMMGAGDGAFARRYLPRGTIVSPAPVIHMHKDHLAIYAADDNDKTMVHWQGHQLLLNYAYGHNESSLVFFPYAPMVNMINHSPKPNLKLQWSKDMLHPEWLNLTIDELLKHHKDSGLMMEVVALRDIRQGEELYLNYGALWEQEFAFHVDEWIPPEFFDSYQAASDWAEQEELPIYHDDEGALPDNLMTVCWINFDELQQEEDSDLYIWSDTSTKYLEDTEKCLIALRKESPMQKDEMVYAVKVKHGDKSITVKGLPRRAIAVVDRPYTTNQYLRQSFRQAIQLPEAMVPDNWRDLKNPYDEECGMYMAESSIPNSGLGMYTAKAYKQDQDFSFSELAVQVEDIAVNQQLRRWLLGIPGKAPEWMLEDYFWQPFNTGGELEANDVQSITPGFGMLANSHDGLVNARIQRAQHVTAGLDRQTDPGVGAFTNYHHHQFVTTVDVEAGSEVFVEYGWEWFTQRVESLGVIPIAHDFGEADRMLSEFWDRIGGDITTDMAKDLWSTLPDTINATDEVEATRIRKALPDDIKDVKAVLDSGTARYSCPDSIRSIEWLKENGQCIDNIVPGPSTIAQAGYGAFATRRIGKDQVIAPAPLVQLLTEHMEVYDSDDIKDPKAKPWLDGTQQLLNYCYGHPSASLLFFPYSQGVNYINHNSKPNAKVQWSSFPSHKSDWLDYSVDEIIREQHTGLIMEFIALRDIQPGEEIFIDYGESWDKSWKKHVDNWKPKGNDDYVPASSLNDYMLPVLTELEQEQYPYPENVGIYCYLGVIGTTANPMVEGEYGEEIHWKFYNTLYHTSNEAYPCDILERDNMDYSTHQSVDGGHELYTVKVYHAKDEEWLFRNVPRRAIEFFDEDYQSDLFIRDAFRHAIHLPDEMIPDAWKDVEKK